MGEKLEPWQRQANPRQVCARCPQSWEVNVSRPRISKLCGDCQYILAKEPAELAYWEGTEPALIACAA